MCVKQFAPSVLAHIRADRFFEDALSEAKDIPSPSDEFEKSRQLVATDVTATILRDVDEADLRLFKDFFTETEHTFESMSRAMQKLIIYKQLKNKETLKMTEIEVKQQIIDETVAKGNAKAHKQTLIDRGYLPADEKEQAKLKENHGVTYQSPWE
jgi:hypothetical protein